jgi:hypothetical protein
MTPEADRIWRQYAKQLLKVGVVEAKSVASIVNPRKSKKGLKVLAFDAHIIEGWCRAGLLNRQVEQKSLISDLGFASLRRQIGGIIAQHQIVETRRDATGVVQRRNVSGSAIDWLTSKKGGRFSLSEQETAAAKILRQDYEQAHMTGRMTMDWSERVGRNKARRPAGHESLPLAALDARRRLHNAFDYVGPGLSDMLVEACCHEQSLQASEALFALPARSGKVILKFALGRLAVFYGFQTAREASASLRMR